MNVYIDRRRHQSYALDHIEHNIQAHAPAGIKFVDFPIGADLVVFLVTGQHDHVLQRAQEAKRYAVVQLSLQSTRNPDPQDWMPLWMDAVDVWSYYALPLKDYYHAPLGADPDIFYRVQLPKRYLVLTNGTTTKDESLREVWRAAERADGNVIHPDRVTESELRRLYNQSHYVACLRRKDGFEMPAVEGLLCGARPIMFDAPRYRQWFDGLAVFVPEVEPTELTDILATLFTKKRTPVKAHEIAVVKDRFNWRTIVSGFWERVA